MTVNLAARGLALTALELEPGSLILVLASSREPQHSVLDALRLDPLLARAIKQVNRANGNGSIALANGTRIVFERVHREGRGYSPQLVAMTEAARREAHEDRRRLEPLFARGAELAEL